MSTASINKIFVGGLPQNCSDEVLSNYFMQYGTITDSVVMKDRETGNSRGFGFVTYESASSVNMVIAQYEDHRIENKWVEVKRATPRDQMPPGPPPTSKGKGGKGSCRAIEDRDRASDRGSERGNERGSERGGDRHGENGHNADLSSDRNPDVDHERGASADARPGDCFKCGAPRPQGDGGECGGCVGGCPLSSCAPGGCAPGSCPPGGCPPPGCPPSGCAPGGYGYGMNMPLGMSGGPYGNVYGAGNNFGPYAYPGYPPPGAPPPAAYGPYRGACGGNGYAPY